MAKHIARTVRALGIGLAMIIAILGWQSVTARGGPPTAHGVENKGTAAAGVLPASAKPLGYSLEDMARATALYNTGPRTGTPPNTPFRILVTTGGPDPTFTVDQGTYLYVPLFYSDNSTPILGNWPADIENRTQLTHYWTSPDEIGLRFIKVLVDGKVATLNPDYIVGVRSVSTYTGGTEYSVAAVFLHPLPPGEHSVQIMGFYSGEAAGTEEFSFGYTVIVR